MRKNKVGRVVSGTVLALAAAASPVSAQQVPEAPELTFIFSEEVMLGADIEVGLTPEGHRNIVPITGGTFEGPEIRGTVIPGGWDWQRVRADGCTELEADYMLRTDDAVVINVVNRGLLCPPKAGRPVYIRTTPIFEAPQGKYEWLNEATFVGTLSGGSEDPRTIRISFFKVD